MEIATIFTKIFGCQENQNENLLKYKIQQAQKQIELYYWSREV
jgi:hypothetical protein